MCFLPDISTVLLTIVIMEKVLFSFEKINIVFFDENNLREFSLIEKKQLLIRIGVTKFELWRTNSSANVLNWRVEFDKQLRYANKFLKMWKNVFINYHTCSFEFLWYIKNNCSVFIRISVHVSQHFSNDNFSLVLFRLFNFMTHLYDSLEDLECSFGMHNIFAILEHSFGKIID